MRLIHKTKKSALVRKGVSLLRQVPRHLDRVRATADDYAKRPPILVNSLPKSGTHLLLQIVRALPGTSYYGSFLAQSPSVTMRLRSQALVNARIARIAPGETLGAHLHCTKETAAALARINALHLFIHRDPRDVVVSEAHYLAEMNRWHRLHRRFSRIPDPQGRIRLAIEGTSLPSYPPAGARFRAFLGWVGHADCLSLRYEDLVSPQARDRQLLAIIEAFAARGGRVEDPTTLLKRMIEAINPNNSHTFHKGGTERWRIEMDAENQARILAQFPELSP